MTTSILAHPLPPGCLQEDVSSPIVVTAVAFIVIVIVATGLRAWSRYLQKTPWMWGDILMPLSMLANLGLCTLALLCVRFGAGRHMVALSMSNIISFIKIIALAFPSLHLFAITLPRLAILDLYLHIFREKVSRVICYACGLGLILNCIISWAIALAQCTPMEKIWNRNIEGHCLETHARFTWMSVPNIVADSVMLLLPIPTIIMLQQDWKVKTGIMVSFLVGGFGFGTAILRMVQFYKKFGFNQANLDSTFVSGPVLTWTIIEAGMYHLAACLITYRTLARWLFHQSHFSSAFARASQLVSSRKSKEYSNMSEILVVPPVIAMPKNVSRSHFGTGPEREALQLRCYSGDETLSEYSVEVVARTDIEYGREERFLMKDEDGKINVKRDFEVRAEPGRDQATNQVS